MFWIVGMFWIGRYGYVRSGEVSTAVSILGESRWQYLSRKGRYGSSWYGSVCFKERNMAASVLERDK